MGIKFNLVKPNNQIETIDLSDHYLEKGTAKVTVETDSYTLDTTPIDETVEVKYIEGNITTVVEGEFVVSKPTQIISKGSNLFDINDYIALNNYVITDTGFIRNAGNGANIIYRIPTTADNTYILSFNRVGSGRVRIKDEETDIDISPYTTGTKITFEALGDITKIIFGTTDTDIGTATEWSNVHLNEGTEALPYQPYAEHIYSLGTGIELPKLPNGVGDRWLTDGRVERNVSDEFTFNGSENWDIGGWDLESNIRRFYVTNKMRYSSNIINLPIITNSETFKYYNESHTVLKEKVVYGFNNTYFYIYINTVERLSLPPDSDNTTLINAFKSWLSNNNLKVRHQLETPTIENAPILPKYIATFDKGHIEIDEGVMGLEIPVNITDQVNANTNHIQNITSGLNQFVKKDDNIPISKIVTDTVYAGSILIGDPEGGVGAIPQSTFLEKNPDIINLSGQDKVHLQENGTPLLSTFNYGLNNNGITTAGRNVFVGNAGNTQMGSTATESYHGSYNTAIGYNALRFNTTGSYNTALGYAALFSNTTGNHNTALGYYTLRYNTTGNENTALGYYALRDNTTGTYNTAIGLSALRGNTTGYRNTALGLNALYSNTSGTNNTAMGYEALRYNTSGSYNIAIGNEAGNYLANGVTTKTVGNNSVFIGNNSKASLNGVDNEIVIGFGAVGKGANTVVLGNENVDTAYVGTKKILVETDTIPISKIVAGASYEDSILIGAGDGSIGAIPQSTFAEASHQHLVGDIQNLENEIDGRVSLATDGIFLPIDGTAEDADKLDGKSPDYYLDASKLNAGKVPFARLPTGTGSNQVAVGNHTHVGYATTDYVDNALLSKSDSGHTHSEYVSITDHNSDIDDINTALLSKLNADGTAVNASKLDNQSSSYYRNASNLNAGKVSIDRLPVGTTSSDVARGNHTHVGYATTDYVDNALLSKSDSGHTHSEYVSITDHNSDIDDINTALLSKLNVDGTAVNAFQLGGQSPSYYLNYNNLSNKPTTLTPLRTRAETTSLTSVASGDTVGSVPLSSTVGRGDTLLIELNTGSSYTYSHKYIMVTLGTDSTSPNSTSEYRNFSFSTFNGTDFNIYSFTVSASGSTLYFGSKKYLKGVFSGTTIAWTTANYTLYVGKVWKVN